ncbi:hypothetical protein RE428_10810 [Marinobacter nanhaiticus D15-8W]|nr:hypothetical protein RE428_10810 [Marinobacter nanhaiticus D15-8W]
MRLDFMVRMFVVLMSHGQPGPGHHYRAAYDKEKDLNFHVLLSPTKQEIACQSPQGVSSKGSDAE